MEALKIVTIITKCSGEKTHILSYKNVLAAHRFVGNFDVLKEAAKALGYEFILWNGKVYRACGVETFYTEKDIK